MAEKLSGCTISYIEGVRTLTLPESASIEDIQFAEKWMERRDGWRVERHETESVLDDVNGRGMTAHVLRSGGACIEVNVRKATQRWQGSALINGHDLRQYINGQSARVRQEIYRLARQIDIDKTVLIA